MVVNNPEIVIYLLFSKKQSKLCNNFILCFQHSQYGHFSLENLPFNQKLNQHYSIPGISRTLWGELRLTQPYILIHALQTFPWDTATLI